MDLSPMLRASNLFAGLPPECVMELAHLAVRRRFERGEQIFRVGERATFLGVLTHGLVKLVRPTNDGASCIVAIWGPRQTIGNLAVIAREGYPGNAVVVSAEAEVLTLEAEAILAAAERRPPIAWALARSLTEHGYALHDKIGIMSAGAVEQRLKALLTHLVERFGDEFDDGIHIPVVLSRGELASMVGATVETTIRAMSRWQKQRVVETTAEGFRILDPGWLARAAARSAA